MHHTMLPLFRGKEADRKMQPLLSCSVV